MVSPLVDLAVRRFVCNQFPSCYRCVNFVFSVRGWMFMVCSSLNLMNRCNLCALKLSLSWDP